MLHLTHIAPAHIDALAAGIRQADADELAAAGLTVHEALADVPGLAATNSAGQVVALFGCTAHPKDPRFGIPWLLCTEALDSVPRLQIARMCRMFTGRWAAEFDHLQNMVHAPNAQAVALIRWLGFTVGNEPAGPGGAFLNFHWSASDV